MKDLLFKIFTSDEAQVSAVGGGSFYALMTDIELGLKILVAAASLGFIIYKWYKESKRA